MADEQISSRLAMASVTALPERGSRPATSKRSPRISSFQATNFVQKACLVAIVALLSFTAYIAASHYFVKSIKIVGTSMVPTLEENGSYILNLWTFRSRAPHHGEIVVLRDPLDHS